MHKFAHMARTYAELLNRCRFDPAAPVTEDKIYLTVGNSVLATSGNFICFAGLPKTGKSTFISAIIASWAGSREIFTFRSHLHGRRLAIFDTEQTAYDFNRTVKRIKKLAKTPDIFSNIDAYLMREHGANAILSMINAYLKENAGTTGMIIIDGILDCLNSFNDEAESKKLIRILKRWASVYDCCIVTVLHTSKQSGNTLGHYGSMSDRYAQSTLTIEKTKNGSFACAPKMLRSAGEFDQVEIMWSEKNQSFEKI